MSNLLIQRHKDITKCKWYLTNYTKTSPLKETTREQCMGKIKGIKLYMVEDSTRMKNKKVFLSSNETKDSLTLYLAHQLSVNNTTTWCVMTATSMSVRTNYACDVMTGVSTQEEADTLRLMMYAWHRVASTGLWVHIYSQDTYVLLLVLRQVPLLGRNCTLFMATSECRCKVMLQPIYCQLGPERAAILISWHPLTWCDKTGHI